jgi:hypothetical protein
MEALPSKSDSNDNNNNYNYDNYDNNDYNESKYSVIKAAVDGIAVSSAFMLL